MDFLKNQLARLQQQFGQLNASQKMLSVSLVTIMAMTLLWWGRYAGQAEMEAVLDQDLTAEDMPRVTAELTKRGIPFTTNGSRVLVPADRKIEALADLTWAQAMPSDTSSGFEEIIGRMGSPFDPAEKTDAIHNHAKQMALAAIIRNFPHVRSAMVIIDNTTKRRLDNPITGVATVNITLKPNEKPDKRLANAAADAVCGAVAGLPREKVHVVIDGVSQKIASDNPDDISFGGGNWMDTVAEAERYYAGKIYNQLRFTEGVMVNVNVLPKDESSQTTEHTFNPKGVVSRETQVETTTESSGSANRLSVDPGVGSNTGANTTATIPGNGPAEGGTTLEKSSAKSEVRFSSKETTTRSPAGSVMVTSCSVSLPRSYFISVYKQQTHSTQEPTDAQFAPYLKHELDVCKTLVKGCVGVGIPSESIVVETYLDLMPIIAEGPTQAASGVSLMVGSHAKEIALGALAVVSLFMVSMMVRKGGGAASLASSSGATFSGTGVTVDALMAKATGGKTLAVEDAAEVGEGGQTLDGIELDDEAVREQQVQEQVSSMIKENPDAAASLIKRWLNRA